MSSTKRVTFLVPEPHSEPECIIPAQIAIYWEVLSDSELQRVKPSVPSPNEKGLFYLNLRLDTCQAKILQNHPGAFGNKSVPNKSPSPRKSRAVRDTLTGRLRKRKGKPGSRRNRRWENGTSSSLF
jgi:hypothetical protein